MDAFAPTFVRRQMTAKVREYGEWVRIQPDIVMRLDSLDYVTDRLAHTVNTIGWRMTIPVTELASAAYPADWWEAFKDRWFPRWALKRWPVRRSTIQVQEFIDKVIPPGRGENVLFHVVGGTPRISRQMNLGFCGICRERVPVFLHDGTPVLNPTFEK